MDDFIILHNNKETLKEYKTNIAQFLNKNLKLTLHPDKSKISSIYKGTTFLGFRIFPYHKLLKKSNLRKFKRKLNLLITKYNKHIINYDKIYDFLEGWLAYIKNTNSYKLKKEILNNLEQKFINEISTKEINRLNESYINR